MHWCPIDTRVVEVLGLVVESKFLGSDLSLGRCLGKLVGRLVCRFDNRAGLFAERDRSE